MATTTAPVYTVWNHVRYTSSSDEVWSGEDFGQALQAAVDAMGGNVLRPLDPANTAALHQVGGRPVQAWIAVDADDVERAVFITR